MTTDSVRAAAPVARLADEFSKLPGIGPKTAPRLAFYLVRMPEEDARALAEAIVAVKERVMLCSVCYNIAETDLCIVCANPRRDRTRICVVEDALDVIALERTNIYRGLYHVLHGVISPQNGIGPEDLHIRPLLDRLQADDIEEIILAINPNLEGDATSMYIQQLISPFGVRITSLARGLPVGGDLEYADDITLGRAIEGRQEL